MACNVLGVPVCYKNQPYVRPVASDSSDLLSITGQNNPFRKHRITNAVSRQSCSCIDLRFRYEIKLNFKSYIKVELKIIHFPVIINARVGNSRMLNKYSLDDDLHDHVYIKRTKCILKNLALMGTFTLQRKVGFRG